MKRLGLLVLALAALVLPSESAADRGGACPGAGGCGGHVEAAPSLAAEGERWWNSSGDPGHPVACVTCHHDPIELRDWAGSFPKFRPLPPPHGRVMTLLQANAEAVRTHYRLADALPAATAITAFVAAQGAGRPRTPGVTPGHPVFPSRLAALTRSVARGRERFARRCAACHTADAIAPSLTAFPRAGVNGAGSFEAFLERHRALAWDSAATTDVVAYLAVALADRLLPHCDQEEPP